MEQKSGLSIKWIIIGAGIICAIHFIIHPAAAMAIGGFLVDTLGMGLDSSLHVYRALVALLSFIVGGFLIGWWSPGTTIKEPAIAGVIAACVNNLRDYFIWPEQYSVVGAIVALVVGFGAAWAGAWLGEKFQGDSLDKMRERGELPPKE
jgi:hypothetical protein